MAVTILCHRIFGKCLFFLQVSFFPFFLAVVKRLTFSDSSLSLFEKLIFSSSFHAVVVILFSGIRKFLDVYRVQFIHRVDIIDNRWVEMFVFILFDFFFLWNRNFFFKLWECWKVETENVSVKSKGDDFETVKTGWTWM